MRILAVSDTHGDNAAIDRMLKIAGSFDRVFHMGDNYADALYISEITGKPVDCVPGNCDYRNAPLTKLVSLCGKRFFLTHGHIYGVGLSLTRLCLAAEEQEADMVLFGHTHTPLLDYNGRLTVLNPGSISRPRRSKASFALIDIDDIGVIRTQFKEI